MMGQESEEDKTTRGEADMTAVAASSELETRIGRLEAELKERVAEVEALNDRLLRLHAEFENYKKRMVRERSEFVKFSNEALILEFLPVLDSLERALATARSAAEARAVAEGLEIILRLFQTTLEKVGVKVIEALDREFDPNLHQAVAQVESPDGRDNVVMEEVRKGYLLEGRLLRPSMVKVSKTTVPSSKFQVLSSDGEEPGTRNPEPGTFGQ
ncbi:MAG: nucleotide exchange factor GrpE [candidate division NC10 bacterium]|nr:nucleotide exchange factor GrpE [candidate division NC10 bacterium]